MAEYGKLESMLRESNLQDYFTLFQQHHITDNELHILEEAHLKELGIPLGPRLKICSALRARGYPGRSFAAANKASITSKSSASALHSPPSARPPGFSSIASSTKLNNLINAYVGNNNVEQVAHSQDQVCSSCFRPVCICHTSSTNGSLFATSSAVIGSTTPNLSAILEFSAFGSRSSTFSPFGSPPVSSNSHSHPRFSPTHRQFPLANDSNSGEASLFSSLSHTSAQMSSQPHSLFSTGREGEGNAETSSTHVHSLFSAALQHSDNEHSLFSGSSTPASQSLFAHPSSSQTPLTSLPSHTNMSSWPAKSAPSLHSSTSSNVSSHIINNNVKQLQTAAQTLFPSTAPIPYPSTSFSSVSQLKGVLPPKSSPSLLAQTNPPAKGVASSSKMSSTTIALTTATAKKPPPGLPPLPLLSSSASSSSSNSLLLGNGGYASVLSNDSIWNENWALSSSSPSIPANITSSSTSTPTTAAAAVVATATVQSHKSLKQINQLTEQERSREQQEALTKELLRQNEQEEETKKKMPVVNETKTNDQNRKGVAVGGQKEVVMNEKKKPDAKLTTKEDVSLKTYENGEIFQTKTKNSNDNNNNKSKIATAAVGGKELPSTTSSLDKVLPRPPVVVENAFDLLLSSANDSGEESKSGKKKANKKKKASQQSESSEKKKQQKDSNNSSTGISSGSISSLSTSETSSSSSTTSSSSSNKVKCECGQIVHPSVLHPITEFQMQDRQAHLTSKRHKSYVSEQEIVMKKEKEMKIKQEKADAQRAKEDAQKAKEDAQKAIEHAQKIIEETQRAEDEEANGGKNNGNNKKKPKKKKERKVSLVHPLGGDMIEENHESVMSEISSSSGSSSTGNGVSSNKKNSFVFEASQKIPFPFSTTNTSSTSFSSSPSSSSAAASFSLDPKKKQLASEIQQEANQFYNKGLYSKAIERYSQGITLNPFSAVLYSNRAQAYSKCCLFEKAIEDCMKSIELDMYFLKSYHRACICFIKMGELKKAKEILLQCAKINNNSNESNSKNNGSKKSSSSSSESENSKKDETPFHVKIVEELEKALEETHKFMERNKYEKAIEILQSKIINQMQEAPLPHYLLAEAYIKEGDFLQADDVANKFIERYPHMSETKIIKALFFYYEEAKLNEAIEILKEVVEKEKDKKEKEKNQKANKLFLQLTKINQLKIMGEEYYNKKQYQKAIEVFSQLFKIDPQNECLKSHLLCSRASVFFHMGLFQDAKKDLDSAVVCAGNCLKARRLRASVNEKLGDWQAVVEDCQYILDEEWDARCNEMLRSAKQNKPSQDYKGYYAALALPVDANADDIKKSYQKQILRWHPRKWSACPDEKRAEAELQYRAVAQAYEVLSDPVKRDKYDNYFDYEDGKFECAGLEIFAFF